jgi:hypothetical protein
VNNSVESAVGEGGPPHKVPSARRRLAVPAAVAVLALAAAGTSSCGTAPPAAIVNGQEISEQAVAQQLEWWSASRAYVSQENAYFLSQAEQAALQGQQQQAVTVAGAGSGPDVYSTTWTAIELTQMISAIALQQYLRSHHEHPTAREVAAAWASEYAMSPGEWQQLAPGARSWAAAFVADRALVDGTPSNDNADRSFYRSHSSYFWSRVCVLSADVSVPGQNGAVDMGASERQASSLAKQLEGSGLAPGALPGGARYCLSPEQLIEQASDFRGRVAALGVGQVAVLKESYGYEVVAVTSRTAIPYTKAVAADIDEVVTHGGAQQLANGDAKVMAILRATRVSVNSAYGTWQANLPSPYQPEVLPPARSA